MWREIVVWFTHFTIAGIKNVHIRRFVSIFLFPIITLAICVGTCFEVVMDMKRAFKYIWKKDFKIDQ